MPMDFFSNRAIPLSIRFRVLLWVPIIDEILDYLIITGLVIDMYIYFPHIAFYFGMICGTFGMPFMMWSSYRDTAKKLREKW
jgi:hypothetical protein